VAGQWSEKAQCGVELGGGCSGQSAARRGWRTGQYQAETDGGRRSRAIPGRGGWATRGGGQVDRAGGGGENYSAGGDSSS
jgi:hypothetical protein